MAEPLDLFRRALAGATRAIARDAEADVVFATEPAAASGKTARVPSPGPALEATLVAEARGAADSLGLRLRYHDAKLHSAHAPGDVEARAVFDALEMARVEALGARSLGGVRENLAHLTNARVRSDAIVRARTAEEVPLSTAVALIARERLTGEAPPKAALAGLKLVAPWIEDKAAAELDALGLTIDDQAAFARLSRRLLQDLDLASAEEPSDEQPEDGGEEEEGEQGGTEDAPEEGGEGTPEGGEMEMRGEEAEEGSTEERGSDQMEMGDEQAMAGAQLVSTSGFGAAIIKNMRA